ncbi:MAG TPA: GntR family transcriptional regulator, partial [Polyangiaceae bacterium]|nr:GntR family transcriptional regulator [Polyangiaceae bacterium]
MPLHAIRARSLSEQVFEQLAAEIITGRYSPGDNLPAERALTDVFDVNRHVVREALKRLEQIGLVKVSQGGGTKVLDFKRHAGLDLLAIMSEHARGGEDV